MATTTKIKSGAGVVRRTPARKAVSKVSAAKLAVKKPVARKVPVKPINKTLVAAKALVSVARKKVPANKAQPIVSTKKVKLVRDSFTFPAHEHALLADMKKRALKLGKEFKKSEILRAGIAHLASLADDALVVLLSKVERVKTGRPSKKNKKK